MLLGRVGRDDIYGSGFDPDWLYGWEQRGGGRDDLLNGGPGADFLIGRSGKDAYRAGPGSDDLNTWDERSELVRCGSGGRDLVVSTDSESFSGCEVLTKCAIDIWPLDPESNDPSCCLRAPVRSWPLLGHRHGRGPERGLREGPSR
jgi:hypothetical protein